MIVAFHLFNDFSGSPKVLKMVLEGLLKDGHRVDLVSSKGGVLDKLSVYQGFRKRSYRYHFSTNPVVTLLRWSAVQLYTFFLAFRYIGKRDTTFYINTLLPVGPAVAGKLMGKRVVYHYHENAGVKSGFYRALAKAMQGLADHIICVSGYQSTLLTRKEGVSVVPNAAETDFVEQLRPDSERAYNAKRVMMLSSLKGYKGTDKFIELAGRMPDVNFTLVINDSQSAIDSWMSDNKITKPDNLTVYPRQSNVAPLYNEATVVLNLSDKNEVIETFGLTALEAMCAGLPVIVPTVGGIAEMVDDGVNGYKIDAAEIEKIESTIRQMLSDRKLYEDLSKNALESSQKYSQEAMIKAIEKMI